MIPRPAMHSQTEDPMVRWDGATLAGLCCPQWPPPGHGFGPIIHCCRLLIRGTLQGAYGRTWGAGEGTNQDGADLASSLLQAGVAARRRRAHAAARNGAAPDRARGRRYGTGTAQRKPVASFAAYGSRKLRTVTLAPRGIIANRPPRITRVLPVVGPVGLFAGETT